MVNNAELSSSLPDREFIVQLEQISQELLWLSETEYPFQIIYWQNADNFNENNLMQHYNYPPETKIVIQEFNSFFASATKSETWHNEEEQAEVKKYQALTDFLSANLTDLRVYLLGEIEIDVYILGKTEHKAIAGLATKIVAT
jgi:hypothetical protein